LEGTETRIAVRNFTFRMKEKGAILVKPISRQPRPGVGTGKGISSEARAKGAATVVGGPDKREKEEKKKQSAIGCALEKKLGSPQTEVRWPVVREAERAVRKVTESDASGNSP